MGARQCEKAAQLNQLIGIILFEINFFALLRNSFKQSQVEVVGYVRVLPVYEPILVMRTAHPTIVHVGESKGYTWIAQLHLDQLVHK